MALSVGNPTHNDPIFHTPTQQTGTTFNSRSITTSPPNPDITIASSCLKKAIDTVIKCLLDFCITVFNITFTFLISVTVLIPAGAIAGLRLVGEFAYNRYRHYEKHHKGELAKERKSIYKTEKQHEKRSLELIENHIQKLEGLVTSSSQSMANENDHIATREDIALLNRMGDAYNQHFAQFTDAENLRDNTKNAKMTIDELKTKNETYRNNSNTVLNNLETQLESCYDALLANQATLNVQHIQIYIDHAKNIHSLSQKNLRLLDSVMGRRNCQACCPLCNSLPSRIMPSAINAGLITLVSLPYLIPVGVVMGAINTVRLVTSITWIKYPTKTLQQAPAEDNAEDKQTISQFPWRSPYPFNNGQQITNCCPCE